MSSQQEHGNDLERVDSFQYPNAHDGHLSPQQQETLLEFKNLCQDHGYYTPADPAGKPASHDNETLLRYLRARKFVPQDAFAQFKDTEEWRKEDGIETLYNTIDIEEYDATRRLYPQWTGRRDRRGIPLYVYETKHLNSKTMKAYQQFCAKRPHTTHTNISLNLRNLFALYENMIQFVMPLCSAVPSRPYSNTPVSQSNNIIDISGVGLKQFWDLKGHMQEASTLATAHYPETLDRIFILGAPSFFPTVWSWIKRWFDPITVSKIFILSAAESKATLEKFIDPANIPKKYGGTLDWDWGSLPTVDDEVDAAIEWVAPYKDSNGRNAFPIGPIRWRLTSAGDLEAVALGTNDGKQRDEVVARLSKPQGLAIQRAVSKTHTFTLNQREGAGAEAAGAGAGVAAADQAMKPASGDVKSGAKSGANDGTASLNTGLHGNSTPLDPRAGTDSQPASTVDMKSKPHATGDASVRAGTSATRFETQDRTHAAGALAEGTPEVVANETGDKTAVVEPRTIGQAPKDVSVPEAQPETKDDSYISQAKAAAGGVAAGAAAVGGSVLGAVGLGGKPAAAVGAETKEQTAEDKAAAEKREADGAKVADLDTADVEDFIRSKYVSGNDKGK